jgi:signal transduction histidine kinase
MRCSRCLQDNPVADAQFCPRCGAAIKHDGQRMTPDGFNGDLQRELIEAREQQIATSEILRVISESPTDAQPVFDTVVESAARLCEANDVAIYRREGDRLRFVAHQGSIPPPGPVGEYVRPLERGSVTGRSVLEARLLHVADLQTKTDEFPTASDLAQRLGFRTLLSVPLMREGAAIGTIMVRRTEARLFTERQVALLKTFADQAAIAVENVRLFTELQEKNRALTEAHTRVSESLEQQTATSEVLRIISTSPTDLQPVLDAIVESAVRLLGGYSGTVTRVVGDQIEIAALTSTDATGDAAQRERYPQSLRSGGSHATAIRNRAPFNIADTQTDPGLPEPVRAFARVRGFRGLVVVPLLRQDEVLGAISVTRRAAGGFTNGEITLLQTFADQAVIAIENVRLFKELESKNRDLTTALAQQTATSEILRVISSSPTEVRPVFDAIIASAMKLCKAHSGILVRVESGLIHRVTGIGPHREAQESVQRTFPRPIDTTTTLGQAILERRVVQLPDTESPTGPPTVRDAARLIGFRAELSVPMLRDGEPIGGIAVTRQNPGPFSSDEVQLLQTFADQAVIAIENVRLFKELEAANHELAAASQHKSEFLANMSHELRTPLNAIIGFSEVLSEKMFGELNQKQEEYSKDIHASGQHLLSLINDILDLSKIEAGRMELELTDFHLPTALDNALTLVRERAGRRSITLQTSVDERLGEVRADERKIRQVVLNLLSNAIKFTPEGGSIEIRAVPKDGSVEVSVSDTGVGIAPEDQEAVFEEFRQVGTAEKKAEGTGLGLTLCRKFVELHGGKIWVKSEVGVGSTFTFRLPLSNS